jgi:hypothetical protein
MSISSIRYVLRSADFGDLGLLLKEAFEDYLLSILNLSEKCTEKFSYVYKYSDSSRLAFNKLRKNGELLTWIQNIRRDIKKLEDSVFERLKDLDSVLGRDVGLTEIVLKKNEIDSELSNDDNNIYSRLNH